MGGGPVRLLHWDVHNRCVYSLASVAEIKLEQARSPVCRLTSSAAMHLVQVHRLVQLVLCITFTHGKFTQKTAHSRPHFPSSGAQPRTAHTLHHMYTRQVHTNESTLTLGRSPHDATGRGRAPRIKSGRVYTCCGAVQQFGHARPAFKVHAAAARIAATPRGGNHAARRRRLGQCAPLRSAAAPARLGAAPERAPKQPAAQPARPRPSSLPRSRRCALRKAAQHAFEQPAQPQRLRGKRRLGARRPRLPWQPGLSSRARVGRPRHHAHTQLRARLGEHARARGGRQLQHGRQQVAVQGRAAVAPPCGRPGGWGRVG